ncbi:MAG: ATP-binding protein [Ruminococcaceae bacterium]|nr:ATP-binding protein [Oscillospiraceae bacterium]
MLIKFAVSNFLSFDEKQELSLVAGKIRRDSNRIYTCRRLRLLKGEALFGANGSGKSNLIKALRFVQDVQREGFPRGFSNSYYRLNEDRRYTPSEFEIEFLCNDKRLCFGFSAVLYTGSIQKEWLYEITPSGLKKSLYERSVIDEIFTIGEYFKGKEAIDKLKSYGEDSVNDHEMLFLTIINKSKGKMFLDYPELSILNAIDEWFKRKLIISFPEDMLKGYPYFSDSNLQEIADILNALGTGISNLRIVKVPKEVVKSKIPEELYNDIISDLEKMNAKVKKDGSKNEPSIMARAIKEFYTFEIDENDNVTIKTIEFEHEAKNVFFNLSEESDGTARMLDLIEILFRISNNSIYVIDEMDRCLHPAMTTKIIKLFLQMAENRNTQLIITTHESRLLKDDLLRNDEISFMMKTSAGSTIIKPLDKYQLRADKKIYEALFDGTLEALPIFNEDRLLQIVEQNLKT